MALPKPSLGLLRGLSDEAVLRALMDRPRLTRAELAAVTGLSKPTTGDAVRRLQAAGLVSDTGERTSGRGGVGTYFSLAEDAGVALAVSIAPTGVAAEVMSAAGTLLCRVVEPVHRPATAGVVSRALERATGRALGDRRARTATVSAADPVDKTTGRLVHLPDAPFLLGAMEPASTLSRFLDGPVVVDNDVNWAARAEQSARAGQGDAADDFVYLYLGEGLGCAVVADGQVRRGHHGLVGEIAHVLVTGPSGRAMPLTAVFAELHLRRPQSTAIDVERLLADLGAEQGTRLAGHLAAAVAGVVDAAVSFADPVVVVLGGAWGSAAPFDSALAVVLDQRPRSVPIVAPLVRKEPALAGARAVAVENLRSDVIARSR
jgi:predicted NBD/HSP70 family sugar kinase